MRYLLLEPDQLDRREWESLLSDSPAASIYHTAEWAGLWPAAFKGFRAWFAVAADGEGYLAGLPALARGRWPVVRIYSMPMGTYGGMVARPGLSGRAEDHCRRLLATLQRLRPCLTELVDFEERLGFLAKHGFQRRQARTHIADLEAHRRQSKQKTKRGAIQSAKRGVEVKELTREAELGRCYELLVKRDRGYGQTTKYPPEFLKRLWKDLQPLGRAQIGLAVHESRIIGFAANLCYDRTLTYWDGASDPEFKSLRPADALIQAAMAWGLEKGCRWFNLGGSPPGAQGLMRFKESWGGQAREYGVYTRQAGWYKTLSGWRR
jgi:CelD/BcsL family acetyltransferase involved in cellulose biosynthesis